MTENLSSPVFIQLDTLKAISDEISLSAACQFCLHFDKSDLKLQCYTSTDYIEWMSVLEYSLEMVIQALQTRQTNDAHPMQNLRVSDSPLGWLNGSHRNSSSVDNKSLLNGSSSPLSM